jgi:hypothetical protein
MTINWVAKTIRGITRRKGTRTTENESRKLWGHTLSCVAYGEIAYEKGWTKGPNHCHGPLGITCHPNEKANAITDCLENQFTSNDMCDYSPSSACICRRHHEVNVGNRNDPPVIYSAFHGWGNGLLKGHRVRRFSATIEPFAASESAVARWFPDVNFPCLHTFIRIL